MREILQVIVEQPLIEAKWLNTVSLLEHIGARKISKTVCQKHPSLAVLEHLADETRHAHAFKKLSLQLNPNQSEDYLCPQEAIAYFQTLDQKISEWLIALTNSQDSYQNYLFTTNMIERRAMKLYPLYKSITKNPIVREELQKIILEETNHMHPIEEQCKVILKKHGRDDFEELQTLEDSLFSQFCDSLKSALQRDSSLWSE